MINSTTIHFETSDDALCIEATVQFEFISGQYFGPPENCYPEEFEVLSYSIDEISYIGNDVTDKATKEFFLAVYDDEINEQIGEITYERRT